MKQAWRSSIDQGGGYYARSGLLYHLDSNGFRLQAAYRVADRLWSISGIMTTLEE
jgi:hypothetical protein